MQRFLMKALPYFACVLIGVAIAGGGSHDDSPPASEPRIIYVTETETETETVEVPGELSDDCADALYYADRIYTLSTDLDAQQSQMHTLLWDAQQAIVSDSVPQVGEIKVQLNELRDTNLTTYLDLAQAHDNFQTAQEKCNAS